MNVDRHAELFGAREQRRELRIVEKGTPDRAADQRALETKIPHGPLKLVRGGLRNADRQVGERRKAVGPLGHLTRELVIKFARERDGLVPVEQVGARTDMIAGLREHLDRDAIAVHIGNPAFADIDDLCRDVAHHGRHVLVVGDSELGPCPTGLAVDHRQAEMLFECDYAHHDSVVLSRLRPRSR